MVDLSWTTQSASLLAEAAIGFAEASFLIAGDLELRGEAQRLLTEALDAIGDTETSERVRALGLRARAGRPEGRVGSVFDESASGGYAVWQHGRDDAQIEEARQALQIARKLGEDELTSFALHCLRGCLWRADNPEERFELSREMAERAQRAGNISLEALAMAWLVIDALDCGNLGEHERFRSRLEELAMLTRQPFDMWLSLVPRSVMPLLHGQWDEARQLSNTALSVGQAGRLADALVVFTVQMDAIRWGQGQPDKMLPLMERAVAASPANWAYSSTFARDLSRAGRCSEARQLLEDLRARGFATMPNDYNLCITVHALSQACFYSGSERPALELYDVARGLERLHASAAGFRSDGPMTQALVYLAVTLGRWDDAEHYYNLARKELERLGAEPFIAEMDRVYGDMLLRRNRPGDREHALRVLGCALEVSQRLGMAKLVADCEQLLASV
jgi:tetratricopeptide (TPR) repeat protein